MIKNKSALVRRRRGMAPLQSILLLSFGAMVIVGTHSMWNNGIRSGTVASLDELFYGTPRDSSARGSGTGGSGENSPINNLPWSNSPGSPPLLPPGGNTPFIPETLTPHEPEYPEPPFCPKAPEGEEPPGLETPETEPSIDYMQMVQDLIDGLKEMTPEEQAAAMDALQLLIDMGAIADPTGVLDGLNTLISAARGDWLGVGTGLAGTFLPYIGDSAKILKLGKYTDSVNNLIALAAKNPELAKLVDGPLKATQKALAGVVDKIPDRFGKTKDKLKALQRKLDDHLTPKTGNTVKKISTKPKGTRTKINPDEAPENIRALTRENDSADLLASKGYDITQNPSVPGPKNPDYLINGNLYDNYAPTTGNVRNIWSVLKGKVDDGQASRLVLNIDDSPVDILTLRKQFTDWPISGLEDIIVIQNGQVFTL